MKFKLIFFFFFSAFSVLQAQIPGYLGKRFMLKADLAAIPALTNPTENNNGSANLYGSAKSSLAFNLRYGLEASYVTTRTKSVSLAVDYLKTGAIQRNAYTLSTSPLATYENFDRHYLFYNLTAITGDIGIKSFYKSKGSLAPLGNYFAFHLSISSVKGEILDKKTEYLFGATRHKALGINPEYIFSALGLEWGYNTVYKDRIIFDFSSRMNIPLSISNFLNQYGNDIPTYNYQNNYLGYNQEQFELVALRRIGLHSLFNLRVGIGILIF
jgi:hypothetical protein